MWYIRSQLGDEPHYKKQYMKKMEYTTKTGYNPLSLRDLGGGYRLCRNVFIHI